VKSQVNRNLRERGIYYVCLELTAENEDPIRKGLFFSLSVGSAIGGNGSLIGASANMVTAGIADSAGYPITYAYFLKRVFPALLITLGLASLWFLVRFL